MGTEYEMFLIEFQFETDINILQLPGAKCGERLGMIGIVFLGYTML